MDICFNDVQASKSSEDCNKYSKSVSYETLVDGTATISTDKEQTQRLSECCAVKPLSAVGTLTSLLCNSAKVVEKFLQISPAFRLVKVLSLVAILSIVIASESRAETTCTWEGTKLIIGGSGTFSGCDSVYDDDYEHDWVEQQENITEIEFGDNDTKIGRETFTNAYNLTSMNTNNVTTIEGDAFDGLTSLTSLSMPNVTEVGEYAFEYLPALTSLDMPKIETIGGYTFTDLPSLTTLYLPNVESIEAEAFDNLYGLTSIDLPKVKTMGDWAFENVPNLSYINIPNVEYLGGTVLGEFNGSIELPDSVVLAIDSLYYVSEVIVSDNVDTSGWHPDAFKDNDGILTFKCKGNSDICKEKIKSFAEVAYNIQGYDFIFDAGDHKECFRTYEDDENISYYHTGNECAELPESGNITCASGYADYNGKCYAQLPFSKKQWTPAEAAQWLHDGNDNFVVITFKK